MENVKRINRLINLLNKASIEYYNSGNSIISDKEYDCLYEELKQLEKETNIILSNSPTQKVGAKIVSNLEKVKHSHLMLSLEKCHSKEELIKFANNYNCLLMMKMDGLTISLEYSDGKLIKAETRGTGTEGSDVLHNVKVFNNVPKEIPYKGKLIVDGEAIITYKDFEKINEKMPESKRYKNPRNLASGSVNLLDANIAKKRNLKFIAWKVIEGFGNSFDSNYVKLNKLKKLGFNVVPMWTYDNDEDKDNLSNLLSRIRIKAEELSYPIDGAVMLIDSYSKGEKLGRTDIYFNHSIAYKYEDEKNETKLKDIKWQVSRYGKITPVAIFNTVDIDGSEVSKASLHNVSIFESLKLGINDIITVYKANMIIPQIDENLTCSNTFEVPKVCPICGEKVKLRNENGVKVLYCINKNCSCRILKKFSFFVSKQAMNIDGFSEATIEKFIDKGWLINVNDIYKLKKYKNEIISMDGFGIKKANKIIKAIDDSREVKCSNFIYALGIQQVGMTNSKAISKYVKNDFSKFIKLCESNFDFSNLPDFGETTNDLIYDWYNNEKEQKVLKLLLKEVNIISDEQSPVNDGIFNGKLIYCTGSFNYGNKDKLKRMVEENGGKFANGYTKKLDYLVVGSLKSSLKESKAKQDNVKVLKEIEFVSMVD